MMTWEPESGLCPRCGGPNLVVPVTDGPLCADCQEKLVDAAEQGVHALAGRLAEHMPKLTPEQCLLVATRRMGGPVNGRAAGTYDG